MGMYTELNIEVAIKVDKATLALLENMVGESDNEVTLPKHPLFKSDAGRWEYMLRCDSFYFDHIADSSLTNKTPWYKEDEETNTYKRILNVRCDLKDYDDEIKHFLEWIYPFTETKGFIGYSRYEEDENPTLIYFTDTGVVYMGV